MRASIEPCDRELETLKEGLKVGGRCSTYDGMEYRDLD